MNKNFDSIIKYIKTGWNEFINGTKTMFKEFFNKETNKKQRANMWTFIRLIIPFFTLPISICGLALSSKLLLIISSLGAGFGALTDFFDGKSARKHGSTSKYGKLLDQVADKVFAGMMGINLLFINFNYIFILLGELLIAGINVGYKLKEPKLDITSTKLGKIKEWPLFATLSLGFLSIIAPALLTASNISIVVTTLIQLLTSYSYIENNNKEIKKMNEEKQLKESNGKIEEIKLDEKQLTLVKEKEQTLLEKYKDLSNLLKQIIELKQDNNDLNFDDNIKTKKL